MKNETQTPTSTDVKSALNRLDSFLDLYLVKKAPAIPENYKELIVKYGPFVLLIPILFELRFFLSFFGNYFLPGYNSFFGPFFFNIIFLVVTIFQIVSFFWLLNRLKKGWSLLYYISLITLFSNPILAIIILYLLFQTRSYYKN